MSGVKDQHGVFMEDLPNELWRDYLDNYQVSNRGRVRKPAGKGWKQVTPPKQALMIARAFVENPHGLDKVKHKNGDKYDFRADNLVWI